jgi:adenine/guanine phosphoribosyltransferase-like PRPP-binding protein
LAKALGGTPVAFAFLVELLYLGGRARIEPLAPVHSVIAFDGAGNAKVAE